MNASEKTVEKSLQINDLVVINSNICGYLRTRNIQNIKHNLLHELGFNGINNHEEFMIKLEENFPIMYEEFIKPPGESSLLFDYLFKINSNSAKEYLRQLYNVNNGYATPMVFSDITGRLSPNAFNSQNFEAPDSIIFNTNFHHHVNFIHNINKIKRLYIMIYSCDNRKEPIDLSDFTNLESLHLSHISAFNMKNFKISNSVKNLLLNNIHLDSININDNFPNITTLHINGGNLVDINISSCKNLESLAFNSIGYHDNIQIYDLPKLKKFIPGNIISYITKDFIQ